MEPRESVVIVTGGASGIGAALCRRFAADGAAAVVVADLDGEGAAAVAAELGPVASAATLDVSDADAVAALVGSTVAAHGRLDLYCSNAGIATGAGIDAPAAVWQRTWSVNVMSIVHAATAYLPVVRSQGRGHLLVTASAAGLLTNLGDAPYTATKHAAVGLAEWLSVTHAEDGLTVSCLCPQGVRTPMVTGGLDAGEMAAEVVLAMGLIEPEQVADAVVEGLAAGRFLILPHPEVARFQATKATDPERWLAGMRKLQSRLRGGPPPS